MATEPLAAKFTAFVFANKRDVTDQENIIAETLTLNESGKHAHWIALDDLLAFYLAEHRRTDRIAALVQTAFEAGLVIGRTDAAPEPVVEWTDDEMTAIIKNIIKGNAIIYRKEQLNFGSFGHAVCRAFEIGVNNAIQPPKPDMPRFTPELLAALSRFRAIPRSAGITNELRSMMWDIIEEAERIVAESAPEPPKST